MPRRSSRRESSQSTSAGQSSVNLTTTARRSRTQAQQHGPPRKRQLPPANPPRPVKRSRNASNSQQIFRPPSINEDSDSDDLLTDENSDKDRNNEDNSSDGHQGSDIDENLLGLGDDEVQAALDLEAIQVVGNEWDDEQDEGASHQIQHRQNLRNSRYRAEVPEWSSSSRDLPQNQSDDEDDTCNTTYPGRRLIPLRNQSPELRRVIAHGEKLALRQALADTFFVINDLGYTALTTMLEKVAVNLNFPHLVVAFREDLNFSQDVARVIQHRLTLRRSKIKRIAEGLVGFFFGFDDPNARPEEIQVKANELNRKSTYIFPLEVNGTVSVSKPYENPVIIRTLRKFLFDDGARKGTLGENNIQIFSSKFSDELEMPVGLVCLAATGVHAAIADWATGIYKRSDFVVDIVEDVYQGHQEYLASLEKKSPSKYHAMLHRIYMRTKAYIPTVGHTIAQGLSDMVDFDGMEDFDGSTTAYEQSEPSSAGSFSSTISQPL